MFSFKLLNSSSISFTLKHIISNSINGAQKNYQKNFIRFYTPRRALLYVPGDSEKKLRKAMNLEVDCIAMDCEDGVASNKKNFIRFYTPRRALLYVPGDSEKKLRKAMNLEVDCIAMDCEDGVASNKKEAARNTIHSILNEGKPQNTNFDWTVRVNCLESGYCEQDLKSVLSAKYLPDTILLPKVKNEEQIKWFANNVDQLIPANKKVNLIMLIESAIAMINLPNICKIAQEVSKKIVPTSLIFGSDDFCASIGALRTEDSIEILYARQKMVLVAKAFGLQAIDMVHINYKDLISLQKQCEQGMRMGYTGKQVIHPNQVPVTQKAFLPNEKQIEWATGLIQAFNEYQKSGVGAFTYKDSMIDLPTLKIAENIMKIIEVTNKK